MGEGRLSQAPPLTNLRTEVSVRTGQSSTQDASQGRKAYYEVLTPKTNTLQRRGEAVQTRSEAHATQ